MIACIYDGKSHSRRDLAAIDFCEGDGSGELSFWWFVGAGAGRSFDSPVPNLAMEHDNSEPGQPEGQSHRVGVMVPCNNTLS